MKRLLILITLISLMPLNAYAKLKYCKNKTTDSKYNNCFELKDGHLITIRAFLYELGQAQTEKKKKVFLPHVAKTIVWIDRLHKEKKLHN